MTTRSDILDEAARLVLIDRAHEHGDARQNYEAVAGMWSAYLGVPVSVADVMAMMVLLKMGRARHNPTGRDNWVDAAGYAALGGEFGTD